MSSILTPVLESDIRHIDPKQESAASLSSECTCTLLGWGRFTPVKTNVDSESTQRDSSLVR
eukprot:4513191-Amphidinium_carterae.2